MQLCATKAGRQVIKSLGTYYILRELYNWEKDAEARLTCHKAIEFLISDEPEAGMENLREVEVPDKVRQGLDEQHKQQLVDMRQELELDAGEAASAGDDAGEAASAGDDVAANEG